MNTSKDSKIKAQISITDLIELKSKGIFIILLLFPFALLLNSINTAFNSQLEVSNSITIIISFLIIILLISIPLLKKGIVIDYQKNSYNCYILGDSIIYKYNFIPNDYNELIITEEDFLKLNTNSSINNTAATFNYSVYKFVAQKNNSKKNIFKVDNEADKNILKMFLEKETNLRL